MRRDRRSTLVIDFPDETPAGRTRFTTTEPALPRLQLGEDPGHPQAQRRSAVENPPPKGPSQPDSSPGRGQACRIAHEAALRSRESAATWTEAFASQFGDPAWSG
ncbi:hypothetical protein O1M63_18325 [Streptomyces mirabilis]|nr:hypothetical protein [Streptomyces mirabilis]